MFEPFFTNQRMQKHNNEQQQQQKSELFTYSIELEAQAATAAAEKKDIGNFRYCIGKAFRIFCN